MRSFLTPVKRRGRMRAAVTRRWTRPPVSAAHPILRRLMHGALEVLGAFATVLFTTLRPKLLRAGATMMLKSGRWTAWTSKTRISTRPAEILRLLPTTKALAPATPHPVLRAATAMHLPALSAILRWAETFTTAWCTKRSALGKRLRATAFGARPETARLIATRPWGLSEMVLATSMLLPPAAFVLRVHRATVALRLRFAALMLATRVAIHGRPAEALAAMSRTLTRIAAACIGRIHRSTLPIPLGLCITLRLSAITRRTRPIRTTLRFTQGVRTWAIPVPWRSGTRKVTRWRSRRCVHLGRCRRKRRSGGRWASRLGFLGLQRSDAERESTAKPRESVGFGFHVGVLFGLTACRETLAGIKSCDPSGGPRKIPPFLHCQNEADGS